MFSSQTTGDGLLRPFPEKEPASKVYVIYTKETTDQWTVLQSNRNGVFKTFMSLPTVLFVFLHRLAVARQKGLPRQANASLQRHYYGRFRCETSTCSLSYKFMVLLCGLFFIMH